MPPEKVATEPGPLSQMVGDRVRKEIRTEIASVADEAIKDMDIKAMVDKEIAFQVQRVIIRELEAIIEKQVKAQVQELTRGERRYF